MDSQSRDYKFLFYLCGITLAGLLLRLNHLGTESITADEVSALLRLQFNSFGEMLEGGVRPDGHPAFTQVLLWFWTKLFGNSEFVVRLPFVLMGTASIWLAGQTARRWFGAASGLATAVALAFLQFPIMYSQLARPYAPGLFFTMLAAYFVASFGEEKKMNWKHVVGFAIAGAGAAYSHYFSLYTTLLLGIAGLFLVSKQNRKLYWMSALIAVALFVPHLSFTISQLGIGGIGGPGGWLGPPTPAFFGDHVFYLFNSSLGLMMVMMFLGAVGLLFNIRRTSKLQFVTLLLWLIPMLTGYFYSIYVNPVLQNSVLLFSFPFLFMLLFSWLPYDEKSVWSYRYSMIILLPLLWYITIHKPFRLTDHFGRLKEIVEVYQETESKFGSDKVDVVFNVDDPYFINYYRKNKRKIDTGNDHYFSYNGSELLQLRKLVNSSQADYFVYGWSTRESFPAAEDVIRTKFPNLIEKHEWYNSAVYVFGKNRNNTMPPREFKFAVNFDPDEEKYNIESDSNTTKRNFQLDSTHQFGPVLTVRVGDVISNPDDLLGCYADIKLCSTNCQVVWVLEYIREGKQLLWTGHSSKNQLDSTSGDMQHFYFVQRPPIELRASDSIRTYIFTPTLSQIGFRNLRFITREGHRGIYGIRPNYE